MSESPVARPAPVSRVWSGARIIAEDLEGEDLSDVLETHPDASAWWVLPRADPHTSRRLAEVGVALDLDHFALADLEATDRRAKVEDFGHARLVATGAVSVDREQARLTDHPVSAVLTDRVLIVVADAAGDFRPARRLADQHEAIVQGGVEAGLRIVLAAVVAGYEEAGNWLEDASDALSDALFEERPLTKDEQLWAFRLRSALSHLRRLTEPMRAVFDELDDSPPGTPTHRKSASDRRWKLLGERHARVANAADALREALASVFDTSLALADVRLNTTMKKLTGWAAIIAVPTLITGFLGENVPYPLDGTVLGFWIYFALTVAAAVVLWVLFRRWDWI